MVVTADGIDQLTTIARDVTQAPLPPPPALAEPLFCRSTTGLPCNSWPRANFTFRYSDLRAALSCSFPEKRVLSVSLPEKSN